MSRVFVDIGEIASNHHGRRFCWEVAHLFHLILVVIELLRAQRPLHFIKGIIFQRLVRGMSVLTSEVTRNW